MKYLKDVKADHTTAPFIVNNIEYEIGTLQEKEIIFKEYDFKIVKQSIVFQVTDNLNQHDLRIQKEI